jgi:hypothetical protein
VAKVSVVAEVEYPPRRPAARLWSAVLAAWGAFIGLVPHVLHHVGPLAETANALNEQPQTATFLLVTPAAGLSAAQLVRRIDAAVPGVSAHLRDELAARDRDLFVGAFSGPLAAMIAIAAAVAVW